MCAHSGPRITDRIEQARKLRYHDEMSAAKAEAPQKVCLNDVTSDTSLRGETSRRGEGWMWQVLRISSRRTMLR